MKIIIYMALLLLSACSTCKIPLGNYESTGGSESHVMLSLAKSEYVLSGETWQPGQYEHRKKVEEHGAWSCKGGIIFVNTQSGQAKAQLMVIGENPLGYPSTTKALVFESSVNNALSKEVLYPLNENQ